MMCLVLSVMAFAQTGVDFQHLTFDEALAKAKAEKKLVFVDCYTTWCGPCKAMHPVLEELKGQIGEAARIVKIDVDQHEELAAKYRIQAVPTFIIFKKGEAVWRHSGVIKGSELKTVIEQNS